MLEVEDLTTTFATDRGPLRAVDGVALKLSQGATLGVVGESGSGKSVLGRSIMGLTALEPSATTTGSVRLAGHEIVGRSRKQLRPIWRDRVAMIFQDPMTSLHPTLTIGEQVREALHVGRRQRRQEGRSIAVELLGSVGIPSPTRRYDEYPHELSGGMRQRVVIAIAIARQPKLLIADEPTTALDVTVQAQILELLAEQQRERHMAMILITHDLGIAAAYTDRIAVMYAGRFVEEAPTRGLFEASRMPYTRALLDAIPRLERPAHAPLQVVPGRPPDLVEPPSGCRFAARCGNVQEPCWSSEPPLMDATDAHRYRCWYPLELGAGATRSSFDACVETGS